MRVFRLDHLVLTVASISASTEFYVKLLGMQTVTFGGGRTALAFGEQKINLHAVGSDIHPRANAPAPGSADLCFVLEGDLDDFAAHAQRCGVQIIEGPVKRTGALGPITSVYLRDPDKNLVEVSVYDG